MKNVLQILLLASVMLSCREQRLIEQGFERAEEQYALMYEATPAGKYPRTVNNSGETRLIGAEPLKSGANWTNGFYPGVLWQLYAHTGDLQWKAKAEKVTRALEVQKDQIYHHDIGFIIMSSFGKAYEYCPSEYYRNIIVHSANRQPSLVAQLNSLLLHLAPCRPFQGNVVNLRNRKFWQDVANHGGGTVIDSIIYQ